MNPEKKKQEIEAQMPAADETAKTQDSAAQDAAGETQAERKKGAKNADRANKKQGRLAKKMGGTRAERRRRMKYGSLSVVVTVLFIAAVVLVNILTTLVADRVSATIDTTDRQYYQLSESSIKYLKTLDDYEISLTFIGDRQTLLSDAYYIKVVTLAEKYKQYVKQLTISYVDLDKNPGFSANYDNIELTVGDAILACGDRYRHLTSADFINAETDEDSTSTSSDEKNYTYSLTAEYALTTGIMVVTASDHPRASFITGHGESELPKLSALLVSNGFTVNTQSIVRELNYEDNLLIIAAPTKDWSEEDLKKLDDFLYNGGKYDKNVMYIADYSQPTLPNLEAFLKDWGFELGSGVVYESDSNLAYANMPYLNTLEFIDPDLTLQQAVSEVTAYGYYGRPVKIADVLDINMKNTVLLQHTKTSKVGTATADNGFVRGEGEAFPYVAMAFTKLESYDEDFGTHASHVLLVNSAQFFDDQLFEKSYSANPDVTIAAVDAILGRQNSLYLPAKRLSAATLGITYAQANLLGGIAAIGIPLLLLAACLVVTIRRRFL